MTEDSHRLYILTAKEIEDVYGLPRFKDEDRQVYFDLSTTEREIVDSIRTTSVAAHFILQVGYFKAKQQFFIYEKEAILDDLRYVVDKYFPGKALSSIKAPSKPTYLAQQQILLKLFDYHLCNHAAKTELEHKALQTARLSSQPIFIFREMLNYLAQKRIVVPAYSFLQDVVGYAITRERERVVHLLEHTLIDDVKKQLDALRKADENTHTISALKHEPRDFSYKELRQEVERRKFFQPLYEFAQTFLMTSGLSNESIKYYASLIHFYTLYKLKRMAEGVTRLYLLCFAYYRFRQINDNLTEAFIYLIGDYEQAAKVAAEEAHQRAMSEVNQHLKAAGQVLNLFVDPSICEDEPFKIVKTKAFSILEPEKFQHVSDYIRNVEFDKAKVEWDYYTKLSQTFKINLRHLFTQLEFAGRVENEPLLEATVFLQNLLRQGKSPRQTPPDKFPIAAIPKSLQRYMFSPDENEPEKNCLQVDRYEFLVYRLLRNALEAGDVYVKDSNEFKRFEDDLISDTQWQNKEALLQEIGIPILLTPIQETLEILKNELETKFLQVNQRIGNGENKHIKLTGSNKRPWTLIYPDEEEQINSPFYGQLPSIGIADLLWFVAEKTGFMDAFTHVLERYVKQAPDPKEIFACVVAMGTNMGLWKMAEVASISHASLRGTARNYLRVETLHAANDVICNATSALPVFHQYDIDDYGHSSSDGQRIETQIHTINARHSSKYFALKKGVSAYTLVFNHVPINAKIIGTHEHESHYVFDIVYNNTTDIKPERHSTDTHGTNQVNFWISLVFGYQFSPRYRDLHKKMSTLVGFHHPSHYGDLLIKPARKVLEELIFQEWPNVQRIMASLAQKDVTQATIVRKLSSYARQNQTKKALWELDNICRTLHILNFIDDVVLRQSTQKALNRGEAYHRFRRAIAYVNSGKFRVKTESEQQIWNECSRLIANAIIYYNTALISRVYEQKLSVNDQEAIKIIKDISPIAWRNVNLFGSFEFTPKGSKVDIEALAACYADPAFWNRSLKEEEEIPLG